MCLSTSISFPFQLHDNFLYNASSRGVWSAARMWKLNSSSTNNFMLNKEQHTRSSATHCDLWFMRKMMFNLKFDTVRGLFYPDIWRWSKNEAISKSFMSWTINFLMILKANRDWFVNVFSDNPHDQLINCFNRLRNFKDQNKRILFRSEIIESQVKARFSFPNFYIADTVNVFFASYTL